MVNRNWKRLVLVVGAAVVLPLGAARAQEAGSAAKSTAPALTDANIAAIVVAANSIDVEYGRIAEARATNAEVRTFAQTMVRDHTAVNGQAGQLAAKLKLTPEENETSRSLQAGAVEMREKLRALSGAEFDRAYIANEVAFHRTVLDAIDGALLPNAENAELKALIEKVRPAIAAHLEHAKQLKAALGSK